VDSTQRGLVDSVHRKPSADEALLKKAGAMPGINAGSGHYTIQTPAGWQRIDTSMDGINATLLVTGSSDARFRTNINVVSESLHGVSPDVYEQATIDNLQKYLPGFLLTGKGRQSINGIQARWIRYTQNPGGINLENTCYLVPDEDVVYVITCSALVGHYDQYLPQFEEVRGSFRLESKP
jgi:hypothetical protein